MGGFRARFPYQPHARHTSFCPYNPPSSAYIFVPEIELDQFSVGEERAPAAMIEGKQQMISHIQDLESWYPFEILGGGLLQPLQAQWFIALPSYISKSDLIADLENFIQTGVLCACCWMSDSRLLELELAPVARLKLLAWFGLLLDLDCCLIWIAALEESW